MRLAWGRWLERRDRCCVCTRKLDGGVHVYGVSFCMRHNTAAAYETWDRIAYDRDAISSGPVQGRSAS